ncbi:MAG: Gfo/Idh/MocA family oxidoreductase [Cryomorphaceae bacterium]|nr:Gfo/Idh/MocA family oxidoreductase [Cryomorphaceae bacterium]
MKQKTYALTGAAGYVAPKHMQAMLDTNGLLVAALDPFDSVGVMDAYFPQTTFFTEFERFDRHLDKLRRNGNAVDMLSVCSPNYLHDAHIRFGLRSGADVICEKPLVLNPWNVDALCDMENETQKSIYSILQLRLHPQMLALKEKVAKHPDKVFDVDLTYIASRGNWYYTSWKGDESKSGGIATNIGIHFFDVLQWIFGTPTQSKVHIHAHDRAAGFLLCPNARIRWFLSINADCLPQNAQGTFRAITIEGEEWDFSGGFTDLHTKSYQEILAGRGFRAGSTRSTIALVHDIRNQSPVGLVGDYHPFAKLPLTKHPFH